MPARSISVRLWLALLLATCVIPVWIGAVWILDRAASARRDLVEAQLLHSAQTLSLALDGKLAAARAGLQGLASSPALEAGDFAAFDRQARRLAADFPGADIVLSAEDGQQLVNSFPAFGTTLPRRSLPETVGQLFRTGQPILRPLFLGALTARPLVGIDVPVTRAGRVVYDLGMTMPCQELTAILERAGLPNSWIIAFIDDTGTIIGRNVDADKFVGHKARTLITRGQSAITEAPTIDGIPTFVATFGSADTGWGVAVGVPKAMVEAGVQSWRNWTLAVLTGLTLLGMAVAWLIGNRIASAIEGLVAPAMRIGQGHEVILPPSPVAETQKVAHALTSACALLARHRQELRESDERERLIRRQSEDLVRSNADLEQFAYVASHDLREPLRMIGSFVGLLERKFGALLPAEGLEYIAFARDGAKRMDRLVIDLLDYSRLGRSSETSGPVDLAEAVAEAASNLAARIAEAGGGITVETPLPAVLGVRSELVRLAQNLMENALKYCPPDRRPEISIAARVEGTYHHVVFRDNGIGIAPEYSEKIFGIFQRLHPPDQYSGTGIGLAACKKIVENHGGRIWVDSTSGQGAAFWVSFPAVATAVAAADGEAEHGPHRCRVPAPAARERRRNAAKAVVHGHRRDR